MEDQPMVSLEELARNTGKYPVDAFNFVREGLQFTVERLHGEQQRHISGKDLCWGLRDYALEQWGLLAGTVLRNWGITDTQDFGRLGSRFGGFQQRLVQCKVFGGRRQRQIEQSHGHIVPNPRFPDQGSRVHYLNNEYRMMNFEGRIGRFRYSTFITRYSIFRRIGL